MSATPKFQMLRGEMDRAQAAREMPWSEEAEQHVLACCLVEGSDTIGRALQAGVNEKCFFSAANRLIWDAIVAIHRERPPVSLAVLSEELKAQQQLDAVGGFAYLMQITGNIPTTTHAAYFIDRLRELSALRMLVTLGTGIVEQAYAYSGGPLDDLFSKHLSDLSAAIRHARRGAGPAKLTDQIDSVIAEITAMATGTADKSGWIYTGLPTFDKRLRPLGCQREDQLVVVAGGSGHGKSALARQWAGAALEASKRVRVYSRETTTSGFIEQLVASRVGVDLKHVDTLPRDLLEKFTSECARLRDQFADKRLWCIDNSEATPLLTIEDLAGDARWFAQTHGSPHLWIVDYLQLFGTRKRTMSREQEVAHVSHELQSLARSLGGVWIVCCQMNEKGLAEMRTVRRDADDKVIHRLPNAGDLRESQAIYHDADRVIALYRPPVDSRDQDQTGPNITKPEQWLCQIKRRKGGEGVVKCWFEKTFTRFTELPTFAPAASAEPAGTGMTKRQFKEERK